VEPVVESNPHSRDRLMSLEGVVSPGTFLGGRFARGGFWRGCSSWFAPEVFRIAFTVDGVTFRMWTASQRYRRKKAIGFCGCSTITAY